MILGVQDIKDYMDGTDEMYLVVWWLFTQMGVAEESSIELLLDHSTLR